MTTTPSSPGPVDPQSAVSGPALFLMVVGAVSLITAVVLILLDLLGAGIGFARGAGGLHALGAGVSIVVDLLWVICGAVVLFGGFKMKNLQSYGLAMVAAILAIVPCTSGYCCLIGVPAGIWAIIVLIKPEVKAAFNRGAGV